MKVQCAGINVASEHAPSKHSVFSVGGRGIIFDEHSSDKHQRAYYSETPSGVQRWTGRFKYTEEDSI